MSSAAPPFPTGGQSEREFDLRYYAGLLWRGRALIATAGGVGLLLGLCVGLLQTPEYSATTTLQIDPPVPTLLTVTDALVGSGGYWQNADFFNTQFRILRSATLGERVVEALQMKDQPPFRDVADPGGLFMSYVAVAPIPETRLVQVSVTHRDPKVAAQWANTLALTYVKETVSTRVQSALQASNWIQEQLVATQKTIRESQERFSRAAEGQDLVVPQGSVSAVTTSITRLNDDFITAQARRIVLEGALRQVAEMRQHGQVLDSLPQAAQDAQIAGLDSQLGSLNLELSRLKEKYKPAHPEVQRVQAQIDELRKVKETRIKQIVDAMQVELNQLTRRESDLKAAVEQQKQVASTQSRKTTELETLRKEADSAKNLYDVLLQKLHETDIAASIRNNNVTVVERAAPPTAPFRPRKTRLAGLAALIGLALGVALVLGKEYINNTIRDPEEVERYLHLDLLAAVPNHEDTNLQLVTEAYQNLRTALIFARHDNAGQVVLVTGTAPQEGKTTTLLNLAKLQASSGERTIVLDCDLRRAQIHTRLGLPREPGLTTYFSKHEDLDGLIRSTRTPNLYALTAGPLPPNPPALLGRQAVGDLLNHLRKSFEWILIDSPPLASVTDALLLARWCDHVVLVIQHNKVDKRLIKRQIASLRRATPNLLGAVLNDIDIQAKGYYYYYYPRKGGGGRSSADPRAAS
jgi:succinoglycan biosynthesis transport protein ExoP